MDNISKKERDKINRYLTLDVDELYAMIPPFLPEYKTTLFAPPGMILAGKKYYEEIYVSLRKVICEDFNWPEKRKNPKFNDNIELIATISDAITAYIGGMPSFIIATIIVKMKLDDLCK